MSRQNNSSDRRRRSSSSSKKRRDDNDDDNEQSKLGPIARLSQNIEMAKKGYQELVHAIIRPPRADTYPMESLGPTSFTFLNCRFERNDIILPVRNHYDRDDTTIITQPEFLKMQVSIWTRQQQQKEQDEDAIQPKTMVVYLHGNASARVEVLPSLSFLLAQGVYGVVSLDFTGSGKSDGDYVSLGYYERYDLNTLLEYLSDRYGRSVEIVLWGRSMGASTALMCASHKTQQECNRKMTSRSNSRSSSNSTLSDNEDDDDDNANNNSNNKNNNKKAQVQTSSNIVQLQGLICDSPFASLPILCEELVEKARAQGIVVPGIVVSAAIAMIARSVRQLHHFDIREITPIDHTPTIDVPALFVVGANDDFIPPHHSEELIASYKPGSRTNLFMVPGGHNDPRPELVYVAIAQFLGTRLSKLTPLEVPARLQSRLHKFPPWVFQANPDIFEAHEEELTVAVAVQEEEEELGMTQERQDDIQNKLHMMLGHNK